MADVRDISAEEFHTEVLESDQPYLIDLWAPWCGPCQMVAPIVEAIAEKYAGRIKVGKLNVDEAPQIASRYGVRSIPSLFIFKNGEMVKKLVGLQQKTDLKTAIDEVLT